MVAPRRGAACRAPTYSPRAHRPDRDRSRPRLPRPVGSRVAVPGATRVSGPAGAATAADSAYAALAGRPEVDPQRIYAYGRSLGTAAATYTATHHPVAGLILESPFTNATDMARHAYRIFPPFIVRLSLDNLGRMKQVRCPVLLFHGTADRLVPLAMGSCSNSGRLRSSPSTYSDSRIFGPRNRRISWSPRIRSNKEISTSARPL